MNDCLRLTLRTDGDSTGELRAEVSCNGFAGHSSAWFGITQLETFADLLLTYPLPPEGLAALKGGYWSKERRGELEQQHLSLPFYPIGLRGAVGCKIELCTPHKSTHPQANADFVSVELRTSYQDLAEFSASLRRLARREVPEVLLCGTMVG